MRPERDTREDYSHQECRTAHPWKHRTTRSSPSSRQRTRDLLVCAVPSTSATDSDRESAVGGDALARYDDNRNGRITCKEARRHGIAPVLRSHPAYRYMRDGDGDGVVCE